MSPYRTSAAQREQAAAALEKLAGRVRSGEAWWFGLAYPEEKEAYAMCLAYYYTEDGDVDARVVRVARALRGAARELENEHEKQRVR